MKNPVPGFIEKLLGKHVKYKPLVDIIIDIIFFSAFVWFGIHLQPQIIYQCNLTDTTGFNFTLGNLTNASVVLP